MADSLGTSASGIDSAIQKIKEKKDELEAQANRISSTFTTLTETIQLGWLNELIRNEWNGTGMGIVEEAQGTMAGLMSDLDEIKNTAEQISQG